MSFNECSLRQVNIDFSEALERPLSSYIIDLHGGFYLVKLRFQDIYQEINVDRL